MKSFRQKNVLVLGLFSLVICIAAAEPSFDLAKLEAALPLQPAGVGAPIDDRAAWQYAARWPSIQRQARDARRFLGEPIPVLNDSVIEEGRRKQDRQIYEIPMRLRLVRLNAFVIAEGMANRGEFLPAIEREMSAILDEPGWIVGGALTSEIGTPKRTQVDLVTAPRAWTLATADYWLGDRLPSELRRRLREQLEERVFAPYLEDAAAGEKRFFWLEPQTNNWGPVCHAGIVGAALAVVESRGYRARIVHTAVTRLDGYLNGWSVSPDGLCLEGVGYWDYGFGNYLLLAETLWRNSAGRVNVYAGERVRQVATTTRRLELSHGTYPSFADCAVYMRPNLALLWLIKERFGVSGPGWPEAPEGGAEMFRPEWAFQDFAGRPDPKELAGSMFALHPQGDRLAAYGIFAFPFLPSVANEGAPFVMDPLRSSFIRSGVAVLRDVTPGMPVLSLAVKGGHNDEPHGHHDLGSYVIAVDGRPLLLDPGAELYTPSTFGPRRFESMMNNSLGHPVPIVAGKPQRDGAAAKAVMHHTSVDDEREVITMDLTAGYDVPELIKLTRTFTFVRKEQRIEILDEVEFSEPRAFGTAFVTNSAWRERGPGAFVISDDGAAVHVMIESDGGELNARSEPVTAPRQKPGIAPLRLGYDFRGPVRIARIKATITVPHGQELGAAFLGATSKDPIVDSFGQNAKIVFAQKVRSRDELVADRVREEQAERGSGLGRPVLDRFGGMAGSGTQLGLPATGFFRVATAQDRQILVDPEGNAFFHLGVCGIASCDDYTVVAGREDSFEWLPARTGEFATAWHPELTGVFSFYIANWIRKNERPFSFEEWTRQIVTRLRAWGFNSAGAFSTQSATMDELQFPYVAHLPFSGLAVLPDRIGAGSVFDPFDPTVETRLDALFREHVEPRCNDPLLIGYFLGNEQHFENQPRLLPGYKASQVAAKAALVDRLRRKYETIDKFRSAWKTANEFRSFDDLAEAPLSVRTDEAAADVMAFYEEFLEQYFGLIERTFRRYDRNHLLLGCRLTPATASDRAAVRILGRHVDAMSVNYYTYAIEPDFLERVYRWGGKPLVLSEWFFASAAEGLGANKEVRNQQERGWAYRNYVEQSAALPFVVGSEWFIYTDQAITGRHFEGYNGEGNNTGLVSVVDRPYVELTENAALANARIYEVMFGRSPPFRFDDPRFATNHGQAVRKVVTVPRGPNSLELDGTTGQWPGRPAEPISPARLALGVPNADLRADFRMCWNDEFLYVHVQVKDPTPMRNGLSPRSYWAGDCVELFIGSQHLDEGGSLLFSDRHIFLPAIEPGTAYFIDQEQMAAECRIFTRQDLSADGYVVQAEIPWRALGLAPTSGQELLLDLGIDNSDDGQTRRQQLMWNGTAKSAGDRGLWGGARLVSN